MQPKFSLSLPQGWSQPEPSHSLEWPWQSSIAELGKGRTSSVWLHPANTRNCSSGNRSQVWTGRVWSPGPWHLILMLLAQVWWLVLCSASSWSTEIPTEGRNIHLVIFPENKNILLGNFNGEARRKMEAREQECVNICLVLFYFCICFHLVVFHGFLLCSL